MKVLSAAERRLIAALDRLDNAVEQAGRRMAEADAAPPKPPPRPSVAADAGISAEVASLRERQAAMLAAVQARLSEAHERMAAMGAEAARLASANEDLAQANRALIEATGGGAEAWAENGEVATFAALQAEVDALRAARAAEIAQMGEILDALDRMLGVTTAPRGQVTEGRNPADAAQEPEADVASAQPQSGPSAVPEPGVLRDEDLLPEDEPAADADLPEDIRAAEVGNEPVEKESR